jgi:hypothetical protein
MADETLNDRLKDAETQVEALRKSFEFEHKLRTYYQQKSRLWKRAAKKARKQNNDRGV